MPLHMIDEHKDPAFMKEKHKELLEFDEQACECMRLLGDEFKRVDLLVEQVYATLRTKKMKNK